MSTPPVIDVPADFLRMIRMKTVFVNIIIWVFFLRRLIIFLKDLRSSLFRFETPATPSWLPIHWIVYSLLVFWCTYVVSAAGALLRIYCETVFARGQNIMLCLMLIMRLMAIRWIIVLSDCQFQTFRKVFVWWLRYCCAGRYFILIACWGTITWWLLTLPAWLPFMNAIVIIVWLVGLIMARRFITIRCWKQNWWLPMVSAFH